MAGSYIDIRSNVVVQTKASNGITITSKDYANTITQELVSNLLNSLVSSTTQSTTYINIIFSKSDSYALTYSAKYAFTYDAITGSTTEALLYDPNESSVNESVVTKAISGDISDSSDTPIGKSVSYSATLASGPISDKLTELGDDYEAVAITLEENDVPLAVVLLDDVNTEITGENALITGENALGVIWKIRIISSGYATST